MSRFTQERLLAIARCPDMSVGTDGDSLLPFLLDQIVNAYDSSRPVDSAKEALNRVILGVFVIMTALYELLGPRRADLKTQFEYRFRCHARSPVRQGTLLSALRPPLGDSSTQPNLRPSLEYTVRSRCLLA